MIDGRFEIEAEAGFGGMGVVYRGLDRRSGEKVAIKILQRAGDAENVRFEREARALATLDHPRIVRYRAHGLTDAGARYLVMEWLEGIDLSRFLAHTPLSPGDALRVISRAGEALGYAHSRGIVHRDVKPQNIFLCEGRLEGLKLLDFGIARVDGASALTARGSILGTLGYMAPEQVRGAGVDPRSDVFGLGCVLYECLTGSHAFEGEEAVAILAKVLLSDPPRPSEARPGLAPSIDALVLSMLAKDPAERPLDGAAVAVRALELAATAHDDARSEARLAERELATLAAVGMTASERRAVSVILAAPEKRAIELADTLPRSNTIHEDALERAAEKFGARLERLADGTVVAMLLGAGEPTDLAARAARCALAIAAVPGLGGVAVVTGRAVLGGTLPVGDVINRAAQLLVRAGDERGVRLDDLSAGLLDGRFDVGGDEHGLRLLSVREHGEPMRTLLGRPSPCVGREREIGLLCSLFEECSGEPVARAALVIAPPGAGKSRLVHEALASIAPRGAAVEVWIARGDPMTAASPFGMLTSALRRATGLRDGEALLVHQQKLRARVARHVSDPDDGQRIAELLGEMIGVPFPDDDRPELRAARHDAIAMGDRMRTAFVDLLAAECAAAPVVLVLEDAHWGDVPSFAFVEAALRQLKNAPLFVIATARPELHHVAPALWQERGVQEIRLGALTRRAAERLVREVLGEDLDAATIARLVRDADGNPLFLEELIRARSEGRGDASTVLAMLEARLQALDPEERLVLRAASVFGERFWPGAVRGVLGAASISELEKVLARLVDREWITRGRESRVEGEAEYAFRHGLFRDAAYAISTDDDRRRAHALAAEWLERTGACDAAALGEHYERGGQPSRAIAWYRRASEQALEGNDFQRAIELAERAVRHGARGSELGALRLLSAISHDWRGANVEAEAHAREALALLTPDDALWYRAACVIAVVSRRTGNREALRGVAAAIAAVPTTSFSESAELRSVGRIAVQLAIGGLADEVDALLARADALPAERREADPGVRAWLLAGSMVRDTVRGDLAVVYERADELRSVADRSGDRLTACNHRAYLGIGLHSLGALDRAETLLREGLAIALEHDFAALALTFRAELAHVLASSGRPEEARRDAELALASAGMQRDRFWGSQAHAAAARACLSLGDSEAAERYARTAAELAEDLPFKQTAMEATLASVLLARGDVAGALAAARRACDGIPRAAPGDDLAAWLVLAESLHASGDVPAARRVIGEARRELLARADRLGEIGSIFLGMPERRRTLELAREWGVES